ncbi:hypothetical protein BC834DRAFT_905239 [Gloeopeniophorella convolvens]|nr:hypothetical protein BC834DRAFT_905239 [Gloeopeniophorella convolvens]
MQFKDTSRSTQRQPLLLSSDADSRGYVPPGQAGEDEETVMRTVEMSLEILQEGSAILSHIPYIGPIAGLLLQALRMRDEVKQYQDEWGVVMQRLARVADIILDIGQSCKQHGLQEADIPASLRNILQSLLSELRDIDATLKESVEVRGIRKFLQRKELLRKVKQYDGDLSNMLQAFQAKVALDARFAQIAQARHIPRTGRRLIPPQDMPASSREVTPSLPQEPLTPQIFFGRDAELAHIVDTVVRNIGARPARVAILGPGGYGKTTLANAVLTHPRIRERFGSARHFVACESTYSSEALLIELGKAFGVLDGAADALWPRVRAAMAAEDRLLCLDNFESPWDQPGGAKRAVEALLSRITELSTVTLVLTMRGTVRPAGTLWTQPFLDPLGTLDRRAAEAVWTHVAGHYDAFSARLVAAVDCVPLAVDLLAHLAQLTPSRLLWDEWNEKHTALIARGGTHRLSSLEHSIQLSLESPRMAAHPPAKELLGVLSTLPDGVHAAQLSRFRQILAGADVSRGLRVLQECGLAYLAGNRYQTHPIIRHFCNGQSFVSPGVKAAFDKFYIRLAQNAIGTASPSTYAEMVLEVNNTKAVISGLLRAGYPGDQSAFAEAINRYTEFCISIGNLSDGLISRATQFFRQGGGRTSLLIRSLLVWGKLLYRTGEYPTAKEKLGEAEQLCLSSAERGSNLHGYTLTILGNICLADHTLEEAESAFRRALAIREAANDADLGDDWQGIGDLYLKLDRIEETMEAYQKALGYHHASGDALGQGTDLKGLGDAYVRIGELDKAEEVYRRALEFHKTANAILSQGNDHTSLGHIYRRQGKLDEAQAAYETAGRIHRRTKSNRNLADDLNWLGEVLRRKEQYEAARLVFEEVLELHRLMGDKEGEDRASALLSTL